jgi:hypothetical protein
MLKDEYSFDEEALLKLEIMKWLINRDGIDAARERWRLARASKGDTGPSRAGPRVNGDDVLGCLVRRGDPRELAGEYIHDLVSKWHISSEDLMAVIDRLAHIEHTERRSVIKLRDAVRFFFAGDDAKPGGGRTVPGDLREYLALIVRALETETDEHGFYRTLRVLIEEVFMLSGAEAFSVIDGWYGARMHEMGNRRLVRDTLKEILKIHIPQGVRDFFLDNAPASQLRYPPEIDVRRLDRLFYYPGGGDEKLQEQSAGDVREFAGSRVREPGRPEASRPPAGEAREEDGVAGSLSPGGEASHGHRVIGSSGREAKPEASNQVKLTGLEEEARNIHEADLELTPEIQAKEIVCHIIADSTVPQSQRKMLGSIAIELRKEKYPEKVIALASDESEGAEAFLAKVEAAKGQRWVKEYLDKGYTVRFDVACPRQDLVEKVQGAGMQALAFKAEGEGEVVQVEGIILALRALGTGRMEELYKAYRMIAGRDAAVSAKDIAELARKLLFVLPLRRLDTNKLDTINRLIAENIRMAA